MVTALHGILSSSILGAMQQTTVGWDEDVGYENQVERKIMMPSCWWFHYKIQDVGGLAVTPTISHYLVAFPRPSFPMQIH